MKNKEIHETNVIIDLNTTFQESLKSGLILTYLFSSDEKRFGGITSDGQYKFTFLKKGNSLDDLDFWETKVFGNFLDDNKDKTIQSIIEDSQEGFSYTGMHHQLGGYILSPVKFNLDNINEIDSFLIELEKSKTRGDINNVLDDEK